MIIIPIMLSVIPTFAISGILIFFVAKTMTFGGVEIGNIKASDEEIVAGIINLIGAIPNALLNEATIGRNVEATAVFEENSVVATTIVLTIKMRRYGGRCENPARLLAR
jgi:hypothetical protein